MAGVMHRTMDFLGFTDRDERDWFEENEVDEREADREPAARDHGPAARSGHTADSTGGQGATLAVLPDRRKEAAMSRREDDRRVAPSAVGGIHRITTIHPATYNEAKLIGESFREGVPVIMNLTEMSDADAKRLVDFAAGLVFGLYGTIERVTNKVFLLSPEGVEVEGGQGDPTGQTAPRGGAIDDGS